MRSTGCPARDTSRRSSDRRGRPPNGYFTKRLAADWLREVLDQARHGTLPGMVRTEVTFAEAAAEYLRNVEHDRERKPSTARGYRSAIGAHLLPAFGERAVEDVTAEVTERWLAGFEGSARSQQAAHPDARDPRAGAQGLRVVEQRGRVPARRDGEAPHPCATETVGHPEAFFDAE
jgi:hypothetical protein